MNSSLVALCGGNPGPAKWPGFPRTKLAIFVPVSILSQCVMFEMKCWRGKLYRLALRLSLYTCEVVAFGNVVPTLITCVDHQQEDVFEAKNSSCCESDGRLYVCSHRMSFIHCTCGEYVPRDSSWADTDTARYTDTVARTWLLPVPNPGVTRRQAMYICCQKGSCWEWLGFMGALWRLFVTRSTDYTSTEGKKIKFCAYSWVFHLL